MIDQLLWFNGITWETTVDQIGWTYVLLAFLLFILAVLVTSLINDLRSDEIKCINKDVYEKR